MIIDIANCTHNQLQYVHFIRMFDHQGNDIERVCWFNTETLECRIGSTEPQRRVIAAGFCFVPPDDNAFQRVCYFIPAGLLPFVVNIMQWGGDWEISASYVGAWQRWIQNYLGKLPAAPSTLPPMETKCNITHAGVVVPNS